MVGCILGGRGTVSEDVRAKFVSARVETVGDGSEYLSCRQNLLLLG